jgi:hypothetical protein
MDDSGAPILVPWDRRASPQGAGAMKPSRDFVITWALIFLFPGAWFTVAALANLAKYVKGLTRLGIVVNLLAGAVLTAVGLTCLLGLDRPWIYVSGFVMEGTGRLSFPRHSVTM